MDRRLDGSSEDEELATRLDQMNVDQTIYYTSQHNNSTQDTTNHPSFRLTSQRDSTDDGTAENESSTAVVVDNYHFNNNDEENTNEEEDEERRMSVDEEMVWPHGTGTRLEREQGNNILIVTNLDPAVFTDRLMKAKFESLFAAYDERLVVRYLKSFRRVRLDFSSGARADQARKNLNNYKLGATSFKCFLAQIIRPNYDSRSRDSQGERVQRVHGPETDDDESDYEADHEKASEGLHYYGGSGGGGQSVRGTRRQQQQRRNYVKKGYLNIPKLTRQYLISPPMSPPENWRPKEESEPCIDVQLLAAIANLVPGQTHELHAGNDSQPGIVVEVCEEPYFDTTSKLSCKHRQPKTSIPATPRPERADSVEDDDDHNQMQ